ncbi:MAG TPA: hypothetical protein DCK95_11005 [Anaerolineaceae bacterium]|nr:hypothetical protein [Anaerolineaceae bacterium]
MAFLKNFLRNLAFFAGAGIFIYLIEPEMVKGAFEGYWQILGPFGLLIIIVAAIPQKLKKKR